MRKFLGALASIVLAAGNLSAVAAPLALRVDIDTTVSGLGSGTGPLTTQPGFTSWDISNFNTPLVMQGVTFSLDVDRFQGGYGSRVRSQGGGGPLDDLLADFAWDDGAFPGTTYIQLQIAGLPVGEYAMQSWHFDSLFRPSFISRVQIEVGNQGQAGDIVVDAFPFQQGAASYQFSVTAPGQIKNIVFREDGYTGDSGLGNFRRSRLNGFTLTSIPEPSSLATAAIGLFGAACMRLTASPPAAATHWRSPTPS